MNTFADSTSLKQPQAPLPKKQGPRKRSILRHTLRRILRMVTCLVVAVCLLLALGLLILRSSWAEKRLTAEIPALLNPILAEQGLSLELERFSGPLPNRIALSGLRLHDGHGLFLEIDQIETKLALSDILRGSLTVEIAQLIRPTLYRFPEILPTAEATPDVIEDTPAKGPGLALDLPLTIRLDTIKVDEAIIPWTLLGLSPDPKMVQGQKMDVAQHLGEPQKTGQKPGAGQQPDIAQTSDTGQASRTVQPPASSQASFSAAGQGNTPQNPTPQNLSEREQTTVGEQAHNRETGASTAVANDSIHGPISSSTEVTTATLNQEKLLHMQEAWQHTLATPLYLDVDASAQLSRGILKASFTLRGRDGGIMPALHKEGFPLSSEPAQTIADSPNLSGPPGGSDVPAAPESSYPSDSPGASDSPGPSDLPDSSESSDMPAIWHSADATGEAGAGESATQDFAQHPSTSLPGRNFDLTVKLEPIQLVLVGPEFNTADMTGAISLRLGDFSHTISLGALAEITKQTASLAELTIEGLGLSLDSAAQIHLATGQPKANLKISGQDTQDLQLLLAALSGQDPVLLKAVLAPLNLEVDVAHYEDGLLVDIPVLHAGTISAQGKTALTSLFPKAAPASPAQNSGQTPTKVPPIGLDATLSLQVTDLAALSPQIGGSLQTSLKAQGNLEDLQAELVAESPNLTTSSGELKDFTARLTATAKSGAQGGNTLNGTLKAQALPNDLGPTDIALVWDVSLPAVNENGMYEEALQAKMQELRIAIFGLDIDGSLEVSASPEFLQGAQQPAADKTLSSETLAANAHPADTAKGNAQAGIEPNDNHAAQATSSGTTPALWPQGLAVNGTIRASVEDWEPLSLFAQTPLKGKNTSLAIDLASKAAGQTFQLEAKSDAFTAPQKRAELNNLNLAAKALLPVVTDGKNALPLINLNLTTGNGEAADIPWKSMAAIIDGDSGSGTFSFLIEEDSQKIQNKKAAAAQNGTTSPKTQSAVKTRHAHFSSALRKNELLALTGHYNLKDLAFTIEKLALKEPFSQTEIQLRDPAAISLHNGLKLDELILDVSSGGALSVEAAKTAGALEAKAAIAGLPLEFINDLAGTTLPPGHIEAQASLLSGQQSPKGSILLELFLDSSRLSLTPARSPERTQGQLTSQTQMSQAQTQTQTSQAQGGQPPMGRGASSSNHSHMADIRLDAAFVQSGGRSYLSGGLDFSRLATGGTAPSASKVITAGSLSPDNAPLTFRVPLIVNDGIPLPDMQGPFQANLRWRGSLDGFWRLVPLPDTEFSALADIDLALSGTLAAPKTGGTAYIAQGRFYDKGAGLLLTDMALETHASGNDEYRLIFAAGDGDKGSLGLEGLLRLKDTPSLNLRGQLKHLAPLHRDDVKITLSGLLGANGPVDAPKVTADILVERGEIALLEAMGNGSVRTLPITDPDAQEKETLGPGGTLDVKVTIPRRFYIRGLGLDSEWAGTLNVNGYFSEPQLVGSLRPVRGYFELISKPFAFTSGEIVFAGGSKINPGLNLELTYSAPTLEAIIRAGGSLENPQLVLESNPPLPKDEVLAHVLFGKRLSELSRFEALQLANSMSELAGINKGNLNPLTTVRKATGFDVLRFGSDGDTPNQRQDSGMTGASNLNTPSQETDSPNESAPTLEAGKYITDSIYIGVEQGITQESTGVRVEIELFPNTTLQGKTTATSSSAGIGWKMDY